MSTLYEGSSYQRRVSFFNKYTKRNHKKYHYYSKEPLKLGSLQYFSKSSLLTEGFTTSKAVSKLACVTNEGAGTPDNNAGRIAVNDASRTRLLKSAPVNLYP